MIQTVSKKNNAVKDKDQFIHKDILKKIVKHQPRSPIKTRSAKTPRKTKSFKSRRNCKRLGSKPNNKDKIKPDATKTLKNKREMKKARKEDEDNFNEEEKEKVQDKEGKNFRCKLCGRCFTSQGLGGHMARGHPGMNKEYEIKQKIRKENKPTRRIRRLVHLIYKFERNLLNEVKVKIPRNYIIKNKLLMKEKAKEIMIKENLTILEAIEKLEKEQDQIMTRKNYKHS